jgi:exonuclease III
LIHQTLENIIFFYNLVRYLYPDERDAYTFWSYFRNARNRNMGWRLDYFIISSRLQENLCDVIHQTGVYGSDHCPIVLLLSI